MIKILILPIFLFASACLFSCEQESIGTLETQTPVIDAYIYAGQAIDSLRISQSISYVQNDSSQITLDDLNPSISDGTTEHPLYSIGNGYYQNLEIIIETRTSYQLSFDYKQEKVSANTYVPEQRNAQISEAEIEMERISLGSFPGQGGTFPDPLEISWDNTEGDYYYVRITNLEDNPSYINEFLQQILEENGELGRFSRITEPEINDFYAINPQRDLQQFGLHRVIVYRVNPEYAALYESSSNSSLNISEPPSNISNGLGIFTGVSSDTLFFNVKEK